jgi:integrase
VVEEEERGEAMKKEKLPRGLTLRRNSIIATFALSDGTMARRSVGTLGFTSVQECQRKRLEFMRQVELGTYVAPEARVKPTVFSVADLWNAYRRDYCNRGGKDSGRLEIGWNHLKSMFEKMHTGDVSTALVDGYIELRRKDGVQNRTINRETALLRAMFRHGTRVTPPMVDRVPAFPQRLKEPAARQGFIGDREYARLVANAKDLWVRAFIACSYNFGFRKGELLNLRVSAVDLFDGWIELRDGETKNGLARKVPMTTEVATLLAACVAGKKADAYVFTREGGGRVVDPRDEWYSLCVGSGLGQWIPSKRKNGEEFKAYRGLNLHDFRRSAIRNMTRRGVSETVAMRISGHKTASVFRRYNIVDERDLERAARLIEAGRQVPVSGSETDTKSDTSSFLESLDSSNSLN